MKKYMITVAVLIVYVIFLAILKRVFEVELPRIAAFIPLIIGYIPLLLLSDTKKTDLEAYIYILFTAR